VRAVQCRSRQCASKIALTLYLLKPVIFAILSLFWLASGLAPLLDPQRPAENFVVLIGSGPALALTLFTCLVDIALGAGVLFRPWSFKALVGMIMVSLAYLAGATLLQPALWLDPLGPLVKVVPSLALTLTALAILEER